MTVTLPRDVRTLGGFYRAGTVLDVLSLSPCGRYADLGRGGDVVISGWVMETGT